MQRHGSSDAHESSHGIDLAPMLDFVLNLLIFFIITAIFVKEVALDVNRPNNQQSSSDEGKAITIRVLETGDVFFNDRLVDIRAIRANVEKEKALKADIGVTVVADTKAKTGIVMGAVDQVRLGGVYNITFTTSQ